MRFILFNFIIIVFSQSILSKPVVKQKILCKPGTYKSVKDGKYSIECNNNIISHKIIYHDDGINKKNEITFYANGKQKTSTSFSFDGITKEEESFYYESNGKEKQAILYQENGLHKLSDRSYYESNGFQKSYIKYKLDGVSIYSKFCFSDLNRV